MPTSISRHSLRLLARVAVVFAVSTLASCVFVTDSCACTYPPNDNLPVRGVVTKADGSVLAGGAVRANAFESACPAGTDSGSINVNLAAGVTDAEGRFRVELMSFPSNNACVRLRVYRTSAVGALPDTIVEYPGRRMQRLSNGALADSLVVMIKLR